MAYTSGFFNGKALPGGGYDRQYNASDFSEYFSAFIGNGVFPTVNQSGMMVSVGNGLSVNVNIGTGFINGYFINNATMTNIQLATANSSYSRIDNIVMQLSLINREITLIAIEGTPSSNPSPPVLVQNSTTVQLCLATVEVGANVTSLTKASITDTRANTSVCGWASATAGEAEQLTQIQTALKSINSHLTNELPTLSFTNVTSNNNAIMNSGEIGSWVFAAGGNEALTIYSCELVLEGGELQTITFPLAFNRYCFPLCTAAGVQSASGWEVPSDANEAPYGNNACIPSCSNSQLTIFNPWGLTGAFYLTVIGQ